MVLTATLWGGYGNPNLQTRKLKLEGKTTCPTLSPLCFPLQAARKGREEVLSFEFQKHPACLWKGMRSLSHGAAWGEISSFQKDPASSTAGEKHTLMGALLFRDLLHSPASQSTSPGYFNPQALVCSQLPPSHFERGVSLQGGGQSPWPP